MKKLLAIMLAVALLVTVFVMPASAYSYSTGELAESDAKWSMPVEADMGFEHPGVWKDARPGTGISNDSTCRITGREAANGSRSVEFSYGGTDGAKHQIYFRNNGSVVTGEKWQEAITLNKDEWDYTNQYFLFSDIKMTADFKGKVCIVFSKADGAVYEKTIHTSASHGEFVLYDNTESGLNKEVFTDWTRSSYFELDGSERFLSSGLKLLQTNGCKMAFYVEIYSGTVWVDNVDIWNESEYHLGHTYPAYQPDAPGAVADTGALLIDDFETESTSDTEAFQYNLNKEENGVSYTTDAADVRGTRSLRIDHVGEVGTISGHGMLYIKIPQSVTNTLDLTTSYHIEVAAKGTADSQVDLRTRIEDGGTGILMHGYGWYGENWLLGGVNCGYKNIDTNWDIYSSESFQITGNSLQINLYIYNKAGTFWLDDVMLVPDNITKANGKITSSYDSATEEFTLTVTANEGYMVNKLQVASKNLAATTTPVVIERADVYSAKYTWKKSDVALTGTNWVNLVYEFAPILYDEFDMGDANGDASVDVLDLIRAKKYVANALDVSVNDIALYAVDFDKDGKVKAEDLASVRKAILDFTADSGEGDGGGWS